METVSWGPAVAALAAGLALGVLLAWRLRATARAVPSPSEEAENRRRDLEAHRDTLLDQLRELDDVAGHRDPELLARERERLEVKAARVLAELDRHAPAPARAAAPAAADAAAAPSAADARRAARRGFTWGIASAAAAVALVIWVSGAARPRGADGQLTGNLPERSAGQEAPPAADPRLAQLQQAVAANPDDLDARLELTQVYLGRSDMMQVWEQTQEVLARSPGNPRALSYQALVRLAMGQAGAAEQQLKQAMAAAPDLLEPRLHLSLVYMRTGRQAEADAVLDEAGRRFPEQKAALERLRTEMKAAEQGVEPMAPVDHPDIEAQAAGAAPPPGPRVSGQIELDPARGAAPAGSIVFVTARAAGQSEGPPLAVKRLPAAFPLSFTLGTEDSMMGQELPQELRLDVRLDMDGDPMTRADGDATARLDPVRLGQDGLRVRLR